MKKGIYLMMAAMMLILTGCSPFALVNSEVYNDADLASYHTFRIVTPDQGKLPDGMAMVTYYNIAAAIREQLVERGFTEDPESPLLVNIGVSIHREIATQPAIPPTAPPPPPGPFYGPPRPYSPWFIYPRGYYYNYYANAQVITGIYKEGVLTMDMVNIDSKVPLYSSSVATIINNGNGQYRNLKSIAEATEVLFSKFPVPLLPQYRARK